MATEWKWQQFKRENKEWLTHQFKLSLNIKKRPELNKFKSLPKLARFKISQELTPLRYFQESKEAAKATVPPNANSEGEKEKVNKRMAQNKRRKTM